MDDYASFLSKEAESLNSIIHQFIISYVPDDDTLHIFFEGEEDSKFYLPAVRSTTKRPYRLYQCGGKPRLREAHNSLREQGYCLDTCLFFVDRDHDDFLKCQIKSKETIYVTDMYSIESEFSTPHALNTFLTDIAGISPGTDDFKFTIEETSKAMDEFHNVMRSLMAWTISARNNGAKINFNNVSMNKVIHVSDAAKPSRKAEGFKYFKKQALSAGSTPPLSDFLAYRAELDSTEGHIWIRGKYELWFFEIALLRVLENLNVRRVTSGLPRLKIPQVLREHRMLDALGGRLQPPASLQAYLAERLSPPPHSAA